MCNVVDKDLCIQEHIQQLEDRVLFEKAFGDAKRAVFPQLCEECPAGECIFHRAATQPYFFWRDVKRLMREKSAREGEKVVESYS